MTSLLRRLTWWLQRPRKEAELGEELQFHLDQELLERGDAGLAGDEARWAARRDLGNEALLREDIRTLWTWRPLDELAQDLRFTLRTLFRERTVTVFAVLSLALGIGANTAIFSLMEAALWKPLAVHEPQQLRLFTWTSGMHPVAGSTWDDWDRARPDLGYQISASFSYAAFESFAAGTGLFERVFAFKPIGRITAVVGDVAEPVVADLVSGAAYDALGVVPILGRPIAPSDDRRGPETVAVISDEYWSRRFGRDPGVVGRTIHVNQVPVTVIGVNPPGFTGLSSQTSPDLFLPLTMQPVLLPNPYAANGDLLADPDYWWLDVMGRLEPGVTDADAQSAMQALLLQTVRETLPGKLHLDQPRVRLLPGARGLDNLAEQFGPALAVLVSLVGVVLLVACANVANLLLARASTRRRELGLRLALGAGRSRLARQLMTEGLVLGLAGGSLGLLLAYWVRDIVPNLLLPSWAPAQVHAIFDMRVLALSLAVTLATSVLFSLAPIRQALREELHSAVRDGGRTTLSARRGRPLIVFQIALSVLLLVAAALFARTLVNLRMVRLGFSPERIVLFTVDPPRSRYDQAARKAVFEEIDRRIAAIPAIESSSLSENVLVSGGNSRSTITILGTGAETRVATWRNTVGYRFFETMRIPMVMGRSYDAHDGRGSPEVAVVNMEFVRRFLPGRNPIGRRFRRNDETFEIVGVCGDTQFDRARAPLPPIWFNLLEQADATREMTFEIRTAAPVPAILPSIREAVRAVDSHLAVFDVRTQQQQIDSTMSQERLFVALASALGVLALILAAVGVYGMLAQNVSRRTPEIGVRMALGASRTDVITMVLREASQLAVIGAVAGAAGAAILGRCVQSMLFGITPLDPIAIGAAIAMTLTAALAAGWLPARRAARLDPMVALRHE